MKNSLYCGDNLEILRAHIPEESIDLCYIDPPFHSRRSYRQTSQNSPGAPPTRAPAFDDTWTWDAHAALDFEQLDANRERRFQETTVALVRALRSILKETSLLAYLVWMTPRIVELHRTLKPTGTLYLHCDPSASHYLKLILDAVFCAAGGEFRNEIIWAYESGGRSKKDFGSKHDTIFRYTKSAAWTFDAGAILLPRTEARHNHLKRNVEPDGRVFYSIKSAGKIYRYYADEGVIPSDVWTDLSHLQQRDPERNGYPTQKPEALLTRILRASSKEGDLVLDAFCGGGTTLVVAERERRRWIGIDSSTQAINLTLKRLEEKFGSHVRAEISLHNCLPEQKV